MRAFFLLLLFPITCLAAGSGNDRKVSCRFLALEGNPAVPALVNLAADGAELACEVPVATLSEEKACFAKGEAMSFLSQADKKPAAVAKVPAGMNAAILVFLPAEKGAEIPWRVLVVEDSAKTLPDGGAFVANLHQQEIRFVVGQSKILLKPGTTHSMARPEGRDEFNMAPVVFQFPQKDNSWATASESMLRFVPGGRYLMFAYVDPPSGRPRIMTCKDSKRPAAAP
ncbi:hypothetical protein [Haloferula sp. BvORR071]|uniref:hypothetical protein n=1 Tax=Haloferula sp. BvORR071 TaxID=1396141 RepID=UPI000559272A|nr:hypothetical protein [Haloferula sp. BvORR071]